MFRFIYLLLVFIFFWNCQKNPGEPIPSNNDVVLNKNVTVLQETEDNFIQYVSPDRDTIKFLYSGPLLDRFHKEQILVSKWRNGLIVKVLDIKVENGQIVLLTRRALLTEIFEKCKLDTTIHINPQQVQKIETLQKGVKTEQPYDDLFQVDIEDVTLFDLDGNEYTTSDQLKADGHYSFGIDLDFKFTIDNFQLTYLLFKSTITQTGQLGLYQNVSLVDYENKVDLVKYYLSPITVTVGPVPVVIQPVIRFVVGAEAKFDVQVTSTLIRQESFTSGLELKNGSWQQIAKTNNSFNFEPPSLSTSGLLKGYAGPQVDLLIYGFVGPYMLVDPYLELDADTQQTPWWALYGGLEVGVGVRLDLFDQTLADVFYPKVIDLKDTVATATEAPPGDNTQPKLIVYYPFNGNANDESGFENDGTVYGAILSTDRFGQNNKAYYFDGTNAYIITNANDAFDDLQIGTVSFWIKPKSFPKEVQGTIFSYSTNSSSNSIYSFVLRDNGKLEVIYKYNGILTPEIISNITLELNTWYHVVFVADGKNRIKFYLNNKEINTTFYDHGTSADGSEWFADLAYVSEYPHFISIGASNRNNKSPHAFFNGIIDDIRVYNYPLSVSEINDLYHENGWSGDDNGGGSSFPSNSLIAYYPFNGNANDASGFGNNGTVFGADLTSDRFGNSNSAYHFDGYNDYIKLPDVVMNNLPQGTFSAWIKLDEINRQNGIIDKTETNNANYFQVIVHNNNLVRVNIDVHYGEILRLYSNTALNKDIWYHVVVTWDGNYWKIYINGKIDAQAQRDRTVPDVSRPLLIGKVDNNTSFMKGTIDDIRIYNYVLTDSEISNLYHENGW